MVSNTAVVLLSVGCLLTMPALALAQDDLMAKARQQFEPTQRQHPSCPATPAVPRLFYPIRADGQPIWEVLVHSGRLRRRTPRPPRN